nr:immunoglobulin light chain junction region [Macaca mulatta]MPO08474.1 immunoglobulin light chain junction region [Macaca mulatta]MPO10950.1 immunoglobulin light chain junction region [Macaca mulatta]MPO13137.1 immunoglobulin light chain junction region [Macaca mulatta]
CMMWHNNVYIF